MDENEHNIAARRFGPAFEKPCLDPHIVECAAYACQSRNQCRLPHPPARRNLTNSEENTIMDAFRENTRAPDPERQRLEAENERLTALVERLKLEAQMHAGEARCHKTSLHEAYQAVTGAKGEPGNWNGANPVREAVERLEKDNARLRRALKPLADEAAGYTESQENEMIYCKVRIRVRDCFRARSLLEPKS